MSPAPLAALDVPHEFARYDHISDSETLLRLEQWKSTALLGLSNLLDLVKRENSEWSLEVQADVVYAVAAFHGKGPWTDDSMCDLARKVLASYSEPTVPLLEHILEKKIKPLFKSNPHPSLNISTGRKLPRMAGGPMATQDYYEAQTWKTHPAASEVILWSVCHTKSQAYENVWHLIIPPVMTLVDDYEASYKIRGTHIVSKMLQCVPQDVLRRTGVDGLLLQSLTTSLTHLNNPETADLIRTTVPTMLSLINLTTPPGSAERFDRLCALLGDGIIGSVWTYTPHDLDAMVASLTVLPSILIALGVGSVRFLKAIVPQLVHPLIPDALKPQPIELQLISLRALCVVIDECAPRIFRWKGTILEGVGKCWVDVVDSGAKGELILELKQNLCEVCQRLAKACPSVVEEEYKRFSEASPQMFQGLFGPSNIGA